MRFHQSVIVTQCVEQPMNSLDTEVGKDEEAGEDLPIQSQ